MFRPRVIPVLLLKGRGLVKSLKFKDRRYIGDPLNAARLFNELRADELIFLDIEASNAGRLLSTEFVNAVAEVVSVPFSVGGGIRTLEDISAIVRGGVEKVVIGTQAVKDPGFIQRASKEFGSSTISVCIDIKPKIIRGYSVMMYGGQRTSKWDLVEYAKVIESNGAGEIILQSIHRDGTMEGYDIEQIRRVSEAVGVPVIALGGAGCIDDLKKAIDQGKASAAAAGSLFVYHGKHRGVLINYPDRPLRAAVSNTSDVA